MSKLGNIIQVQHLVTRTLTEIFVMLKNACQTPCANFVFVISKKVYINKNITLLSTTSNYQV